MTCLAPDAEDTGTIAAASPTLLPRFSINIPTINLSNVRVSEVSYDAGTGAAPRIMRVIDIPWIADYISGVYRYAVFIASVFAAIMLMLGGVQWLTAGGSPARIGAAKKRIKNAVIGLVLVLTSFMLLNGINPDLVMVRPLRVKQIEQDPIYWELMNTQEETDPESSRGGRGGSGSGSGGFGGVSEPVAGTQSPTVTSCPVSLTAEPGRTLPTSEGHSREFGRAIVTAITATSVRDRVLQIAEAAVECQAYFGSCGRTVSSIYVLAGVSIGTGASDDPTCLENTRCGTWGGLAGSADVVRADIEKYRCCLESSHPSCQRPLSRQPSNCVTKGCTNSSRPGCGNDSRAATSRARDALEARGQAAGYPDTLANALEPGDFFIVYNGNSSPRGTHSALFLGWASGGRAQVIQGSVSRLTSYGTQCIKSSCGNSRKPLLWVHKPDCTILRGTRCAPSSSSSSGSE
jgi:hypothetical protein